MSTYAYTHTYDNPNDLYELQTLPRGGLLVNDKLETAPWSKGMAANAKREKNTEKKRDGLTLKERLFGHKKGRKASNTVASKYDVVRNVSVENGKQKDLKRDDYMPARTSYTHGHKLEPHSKTSWCDTCEELIWGMNIQAVRCQYCRYTCHSKCVSDVYLECTKQKSLEDLTKESVEISNNMHSTNMDDNNNLPSFVTSISELGRLIDEYNDRSTLMMTMHNDCTFDGFIRVHMNLNRPVNMSADVSNLTLKKAVARNKAGRSKVRRPVTEIFPAENSPSGYDSGVVSCHTSSPSYDSGIGSSHSNDSGVSSPQLTPPLSPVEDAAITSMYNARKAQRKLSFYMPKGTYKPLHVTSTTTVREVIEALLSKYNVTDNPKKYALFEKCKRKEEDEEVKVVYKQLPDEEKPLVLLLSWGANSTSRSFALKEDEAGHIQWSNFETPELENFLKILQMEEDQFMAQIIHKYETYKQALVDAMEGKNTTV